VNSGIETSRAGHGATAFDFAKQTGNSALLKTLGRNETAL
jgi:hypothetical protein